MHQLSCVLFSGLVALSLTVAAVPAHASWSVSIQNVMDLVYCLVGSGDCAGLQPGADTIDTTLDNVDDNAAAFQLGVSVLCEGCFNEGMASVSCVDITSDNQASYDEGYAQACADSGGTLDCAGVCGGDAVIDCNNVCGGDGSSCASTCYSTEFLDYYFAGMCMESVECCLGVGGIILGAGFCSELGFGGTDVLPMCQ